MPREPKICCVHSNCSEHYPSLPSCLCSICNEEQSCPYLIEEYPNNQLGLPHIHHCDHEVILDYTNECCVDLYNLLNKYCPRRWIEEVEEYHDLMDTEPGLIQQQVGQGDQSTAAPLRDNMGNRINVEADSGEEEGNPGHARRISTTRIHGASPNVETIHSDTNGRGEDTRPGDEREQLPRERVASENVTPSDSVGTTQHSGIRDDSTRKRKLANISEGDERHRSSTGSPERKTPRDVRRRLFGPTDTRSTVGEGRSTDSYQQGTNVVSGRSEYTDPIYETESISEDGSNKEEEGYESTGTSSTSASSPSTPGSGSSSGPIEGNVADGETATTSGSYGESGHHASWDTEDGDEEAERNYYTCVVHGRYTKRPAHKGQAPNGIIFFHGSLEKDEDHYHIVWRSSHKNSARTRKSLVQYLGGQAAALEEAIRTTQRIRDRRAFILYCLRQNLTRKQHFGAEAQKFITEMAEMAHEAVIEIAEKCAPYMENKRMERKTIATRRNPSMTNDLIELIYSRDCFTTSELQETLTEEENLELIRKYGTSYYQQIKMITKIKKDKYNAILKRTPYLAVLLSKLKIQRDRSQIKWLEDFFKKNDVLPAEFYAKFILIKDMYIDKINTLVIQGVSNGGKSSLITAMLDLHMPERISREASESQFIFQELITANCALIEEPLIGQKMVNTYKELLGGATLATDKKYDNKDHIKRLPIFITTNQDIGNWATQEDRIALNNRIFKFYFRTTVTNDESVAAGGGHFILAPPRQTKVTDILTHILIHWPEIEEQIKIISTSKTQAKEIIKWPRKEDDPKALTQLRAKMVRETRKWWTRPEREWLRQQARVRKAALDTDREEQHSP